jgi:hypothetical protein
MYIQLFHFKVGLFRYETCFRLCVNSMSGNRPFSMFDVPFLARDIQLIRDILVTVISVLVNVLRQWPFLVMLRSIQDIQ